MSFVWRSGLTSTTPLEMSNTELLAIRIIITAVLGTGVIYGFLIAITFHRYGVVMDRAWRERIGKWIKEKDTVSQASFARPASDNPYITYGPFANDSAHYQPSFIDGGYARDPWALTYSSDTYADSCFWYPVDYLLSIIERIFKRPTSGPLTMNPTLQYLIVKMINLKDWATGATRTSSFVSQQLLQVRSFSGALVCIRAITMPTTTRPPL